MVSDNIYRTTDYKTFVANKLRNRGSKGHGERRRLSEAIGCQDSYVSLVLSGNRHFSIEQAEAVCRHLLLDEDENETFLLMVLAERAGTAKAANYFNRKCSEKKKRHLNLRSRISIKEDLVDRDKMIYYSDSLYAKVHIFLTIPGARSLKFLSDYFRVSSSRMAEVCRFF